MKLMTWNTSKAKLSNKINNIIHAIQTHKPSIMAIQEVNFTSNDDLSEVSIPGYTIEMDQLINITGRSRSALIIHESIRYSRRLDLETQTEAHVWIAVQLAGNRKINVQCLYRQWQSVGVNGAIPISGTPASQKQRLWDVSQKWKVAMMENETISLSDTNVDFNTLHMRPDQMDHQNRKLVPLIKILQSQIFNEGASFIPTNSTRYNPISKKYNFLDHMITNRPENVISHLIQPSGASDHDMCIFTIKTTTKPNHPKYICYIQRHKKHQLAGLQT